MNKDLLKKRLELIDKMILQYKMKRMNIKLQLSKLEDKK